LLPAAHFLVPLPAPLAHGEGLLFLAATATAEIYTLSLHDALPIYPALAGLGWAELLAERPRVAIPLVFRSLGETGAHASVLLDVDRKSTRLNSSHVKISYAVFCLKKKNWAGTAPDRRATAAPAPTT